MIRLPKAIRLVRPTLAQEIAAGAYPDSLCYTDAREPAHLTDEAIAIAEKAMRLALARRVDYTLDPGVLTATQRHFIAIARCMLGYPDCYGLASRCVIGATIYDRTIPARTKASRVEDEPGMTTWMARHIGVRACSLARRVGRHDRFVFVGMRDIVGVACVPIRWEP